MAHDKGRFLAGPIAPAFVFAGCGLFAVGLPPVSDHAYQFDLAGRVLDGARLYVDAGAGDMHPPLFTWLAVILEGIARALGIEGIDLFPTAILITAAVSLFATWRIGPRSPFLFTVILVAIFPIASHFYGQGEHIAVLLALPYLFGAARTGRRETLPRGLRVFAGTAAALGLAMKPYYALVWLGVEAWLARRNGLRSLIRIESTLIGSLFAAYVIATALITPEFFELLPWLMVLYPEYYPRALFDLVFDPRTLLPLAAIGAAFAVRRSAAADLVQPLAIATVAMFLSVVAQRKGWGYHWYPVIALSLISIAAAADHRWSRVRHATLPVAAATLVLMLTQIERTAGKLAEPPTFLPELLRILDRDSDQRAIGALSSHIQAGFPLVSYAGRPWALPYAHYWMFPAVARMAIEDRVPDFWPELERDIFDRTWQALRAHPHGHLIVERPTFGQIDMRRVFSRDPRFRQLFEQATLVDTAGFYAVYRLP